MASFMPHHHAWQLGQTPIAAVGGADLRSVQGADAPLNQSREAHHAAWPLHSPEGAMHSQVVHTGTKAGSQGNPSQLEDCHQSKQVILSKARQLADQQVCAPGRTRTCTLRIRSRPRAVHTVLHAAVLAGQVGWAVQLMRPRRAE